MVLRSENIPFIFRTRLAQSLLFAFGFFGLSNSALASNEICIHFAEGAVAVVDAYSSSAELAPWIKENSTNMNLLHIQSSPEFAGSFEASFRPYDFSTRLINDPARKETLDAIVQFLRAHSPPVTSVIAGAESGVLVADEIAMQLGLANRNEELLTLARRDKYIQGEVLKAAGVPEAGQLLAKSPQEAIDWMKKMGYPSVVLKPPRSMGSDKIFFAKNDKEISKGFKKIFKKRNRMLEVNEAVLVMEDLGNPVESPEYAVNAVVADGQVIISDIWLYERELIEGGGTRYLRDILLPFRGEAQDQLAAHLRLMIPALGIRNGPVHAEIKMTKKGPRRVEVAARMCGANLPKVVKYAAGRGQVELTALAYLAPEAFKKLGNGYALGKHASVVFLASEGKGGMLDVSARDALLKLPGVADVQFSQKEGKVLAKTVDAGTTVGYVVLVHESEAVANETARTIREWELQGRWEK